MTEPAPVEAPKPLPPSLGELFELSLTALVNAPGVAFRLSERPAPGPGASLLVALAWGAAFFGQNLVHAALAYPGAIQAYAPRQLAAAAFAALAIWTSLALLAASLLYGLGRILGSAGDFDRALLLSALVLAAAPVHALLCWFPMAWIAPALIAAWIAACGLTELFKADRWAARGACSVLAAAALALQYGAGLAVEKYSAAAQFAAAAAQSAPSFDQMAELQKQMLQVQAAAADLKPAATGVIAAPAGASSLDLLRGPAGETAPAAGPTELQQVAQMSAQGDAMNKSMVAMLDTMGPLLNNPMITQNMGPAQKADFAELTGMIRDLKAGMAARTITSPQEQQAKMAKIQQLVMRVMSSGMTMPKPQAGK